MHAIPNVLTLLHCAVLTVPLSAAEVFNELWQSDSYRAAVFSPDETVVAASYGNGIVHFLNSTNGALLQSLDAQTNLIWDVEFSPNGENVVVAGNEKSVKVFRYPERTLRHAFAVERSAPAIAISPDSSMLAVSTGLSNIALYALSSGELIRSWTDGNKTSTLERLNVLKFTPDGTRLASGSGARGLGVAVKMWDVASGALLWSNRTAQSYGVDSIAISPDGEFLATGRSVLEFWHTDTGALRYSIPQVLFGASFSPQAPVFLTAGTNLTLYSLSPKLLLQQTGPSDLGIFSRKVRFSKSGRYFLVSGMHLHVYETPQLITDIQKTGQELQLHWIGPDQNAILETTTDLKQPWTPLPGSGPGTITLPIRPGNQFIRLKR